MLWHQATITKFKILVPSNLDFDHHLRQGNRIVASTEYTEDSAHQTLVSQFQQMIGVERAVSITRRSVPEEKVKETLLVRQDSHASISEEAKPRERHHSHGPMET